MSFGHAVPFQSVDIPKQRNNKGKTIKSTFYSLPKAMYDLDAIKVLLAHENNAILYKKLESNMLDMEKIIVSNSIVYIISGRVEIQTYDYRKFVVNEGEMLFMPKESYLISDYLKNGKEMEVYLFFFDHTLTSEFVRQMQTKKSTDKSTIAKLSLSNNLLNYIDALQNVNYENRENMHLLKIKIFELLHLVCESNKDFIYNLQAQEDVEIDIETYMLEHFDKELSISDWASLSGQSLSTFNRKFKNTYNLSPKQWLTKHNMALADQALREGTSVSACASMFGYNNTSNFIKAFKKIYKKTPKQHVMS